MKGEHLALLLVIIGAVIFTVFIQERAAACKRINERNLDCVLQLR